MSRVSLKVSVICMSTPIQICVIGPIQIWSLLTRPSVLGRGPSVIKSHLGFTVNRAAIATEYVQKRYGDKTNFTMFGGVVMNKIIGGINLKRSKRDSNWGQK